MNMTPSRHLSGSCVRGTALASAFAAVCLLAAGCSSSGGSESGSDAAPAGQAGTPRLKVALITHSAPGDVFWELVQKGAQAAAAKDNIDLTYMNDPVATGQADLVRDAVADRVDGIAVTLAKPDAMKSTVAKAKKAGIPVVGFNGGVDDWKGQGLLEYFGQDEYVAGKAFGRKLNDEGAKHNICVIMEQGHVALEARCKGVKEGFKGKTDVLYVNGTNMPSVKSTITAKLKQDSSIDYVVTLGAPFAMTAVQSLDDAGSKAKLATFDLNKDLIGAIDDGDIQFAVDQQPYLQGYLSVDSLWLYKTNGNFSGGGQAPVLTGPAFVDKSNVETIAKFAAKGTR